MLTPLISIIIPTYNHAQEIEKCLESIFQQTFQDFEVIVVNDGSEDKVVEVLKKYEDRITLINQPHQGANVARNTGFRVSKGDFLLFCDADLTLIPEMLEKMLKTLRANPDKSYAYSSFKFGWKKFPLWEFEAQKLKKLNYINVTSLMRREHFVGFDPNLKKFQDWDFWLTMLEKGYTGIWIPEVLFKVKPRQKGGISKWLPSIFYKIPWQKFGFTLASLKKYQEAEKIIKLKHHLG